VLQVPWYTKLAAVENDNTFDAILVATDDEAVKVVKAGLVKKGGGICSITPPPTAEVTPRYSYYYTDTSPRHLNIDIQQP